MPSSETKSRPINRLHKATLGQNVAFCFGVLRIAYTRGCLRRRLGVSRRTVGHDSLVSCPSKDTSGIIGETRPLKSNLRVVTNDGQIIGTTLVADWLPRLVATRRQVVALSHNLVATNRHCFRALLMTTLVVSSSHFLSKERKMQTCLTTSRVAYSGHEAPRCQNRQRVNLAQKSL